MANSSNSILVSPPEEVHGSAFSLEKVLSLETSHICKVHGLDHLAVPKNGKCPSQLGLAMSGGGVRSATYGLGVIQGLAESDRGSATSSREPLLKRFGYISSVSGGSYVTAWLTTWIRFTSFDHVLKALQTFESSETVSAGTAPTNTAAEQSARYRMLRPLTHLRQYSSYLTPTRGTMSSDTWTGIAAYLLRLLPNLLWLLLAASALITLPFALRNLSEPSLLDYFGGRSSIPIAASLDAILLVWLWRGGPPKRQDASAYRDAANRFGTALFLASLLSTPLIVRLIHLNSFTKVEEALGPLPLDMASGTHAPATITVVTFLNCFVLLTLAGQAFVLRTRALWQGNQSPRSINDFLRAVVASTLGAATLTITMYMEKVLPDKAGDAAGDWLTVITPLTLLLAYLVMSCVYLVEIRYDDEHQEWLNRVWGTTANLAVMWAVVAAVAMLLPHYLCRWTQGGLPWHHWTGALGAAAAWIGTTYTTLRSAFSAKTGQPSPSESVNVPLRMRTKQETSNRRLQAFLAAAAPYVVLGGGLTGVSLAGKLVLQHFAFHQQVSNLIAELVAFAVAFFLTWTIGSRLDVNRLSLHNVYRFLLSKCYMDAMNSEVPTAGTARRNLRPGNSLIADLCSEIKQHVDGEEKWITGGGPYPLFNATLNVTKSDELSLQKRKALNFIFSPLFCGFHHEKGDRPAKDLADFAYRPTKEYLRNRPALLSLSARAPHVRGSVTTAEAMAISGAAASPNMGNHTSPPVAVLLALANIRLGTWAGNPRHEEAWRGTGSDRNFRLLLDELLAQADDQKTQVYLSDGGHFENLGIYELVRRKCRVIVCSDADCDRTYLFKDLMNAIERCYVDFGVRIDIDTSYLKPYGKSGFCRQAFSVGNIVYKDGSRGALVLLKPVVTKHSWSVVRFYDSSNVAFPHEPTANQWFDEEQFEAYRLIGLEAARSFQAALNAPAPSAPPPGCKAEAWTMVVEALA